MLFALIGAGLGAPALADEAPDQPIVVTGQKPAGPALSASGASDYAVTDLDIATLPTGGPSALSDVLAQMPGVAIDQNQQIHIRNTEGPQFQYQIDGVLVPIDINTNPPFLAMINPQFVSRIDLVDGVLPARYAYATGGVVDIRSKDGCTQPGGGASLTLGQHGMVAPSAYFGGCAGKLSYWINAQYQRGQTAFSQATPGPEPIHDLTHQAQALAHLRYQFDAQTRLTVTLSASSSNNQLPDVPDLAPAFALAGVVPMGSAAIDSRLDFRDRLAIVALSGGDSDRLTWQIAAVSHTIVQQFRPDTTGELIYQGVASTTTHVDHDTTLEGDATLRLGAHSLSAGFYAGRYLVNSQDSTLAFAVDAEGNPVSSTPVLRQSSLHQPNLVLGVYLDDLWQITPRLKLDTGLRFDRLTGFTRGQQLDPTVNLTYRLGERTSVHAGFARYMQVPGFKGIAPDAATLFAGTTASTGSGAGVTNPLTEDDAYWDAGLVQTLGDHWRMSLDGYYERTTRYLDTGQFGVVPIFAPFNYGKGHIWGAELAASYRKGPLSAYANLTLGQNWQQGVASGRFNFDPDELAFIDHHAIALDHQPLVGVSAGLAWHGRHWAFSLDALYSSGLRGGFADQTALPQVIQANAAIERSFHVPGLGEVTNRITVVNLTDRTNLIRPADGIGIFQAAYGPRLTVTDTLSLRF
jgi:outer membrane cobalamin receptor